MAYFFDTYAFYEYIKGSKNYEKYFRDFPIITTRYNLIELFYILLRDYDLQTAKKYYNLFLPFIIDFSDEIVEKAVIFRLKNISLNISYIDAIGYELAKSKGLKFLTGDKAFQNMPDVEFVK